MAQHLTKTLYVDFSFVTHILQIPAMDIPTCRVNHGTSPLEHRRLKILQKSPSEVTMLGFQLLTFQLVAQIFNNLSQNHYSSVICLRKDCGCV